MSQKPLRVSLIGYGYVGKTFHAPLICAVEGLALTVVGSSRPDDVHAMYPDARVCSFEEAAVADDVDLVVIATPNTSHFPLAAAALRAGKHVVVDKPFTTTLADARELVALAKEHDRLLSVFHNRRWDSEVLATKAVLESGALGRVTHYECHMDRFRPVVRKRWREDQGEGAGLWFDLGPHLIDQAVHLFGLPEAVTASFGTLRDGGQTDDWAHVLLTYPGLRVILNSTLLAAGRGPRTTVHGTAATWMKYGADTQEPQLQAGMLPSDPLFGHDPDPGILIDGATGERTEIPAPRGLQQGYYEEIRDAILSGQPPRLTGKDAIAVMAILETTFASGREGRTLPLPLTEEERHDWKTKG
ncbi:Predicted dehydrogenase [Granulicella pectinivorans]|uniref:Predicted dehydrogenase n=1 Tax=Granulicella pectinivorans TaxID=474950 RepID=A0A1I6L5A7_9BACT|nr:oxidoreductase [Granulicella pectinivorans]SFR98661.1 Predicted dehydrogenase [Granulicella pectinivorans]